MLAIGLSQWRLRPKATASSAPVTNSGIDEVARPTMTMPRSISVSRFRAAMTPAMIASGAVISIARPASFDERNSAGARRPFHTSVRWFLHECPKSRVTKPFSTRQY